jgi:hypothetical protein
MGLCTGYSKARGGGDLNRIEVPERCIFGFPLAAEAEGPGATPMELIGTRNAMQSKVSIKYILKWPGAATD